MDVPKVFECSVCCFGKVPPIWYTLFSRTDQFPLLTLLSMKLAGSTRRAAIHHLEQGPLPDIHVAALFTLVFFGFLCWDDLSRLTVDNLQFEDSHLAIFLTQRKNDQFCQGSWVFIAHSDSSPCPVAVVEKLPRVGIMTGSCSYSGGCCRQRRE